MAELTTRPYADGDAIASCELMNAIDRHDGGEPGWTATEIHSLFTSWTADPATDSRLYETADGELAAVGMIATPPAGSHRADTFGGVHPQHRRQGIGRALLTWQRDRIRDRQAQQAPDAQWHIAVGCAVNDDDAQQLFRSFDLAAVRYFFEMTTDPSAAWPVPAPEGIEIRAYSDEFRRPLYDTFIEAFSDMWGFQHRAFDSWQARSVDNGGFRADLSRLALAGDEVVGFVMAYDSADDGLHIGQIGTGRAWRRKGVASSLIAGTLTAAAAEGKKRAGLGVDADSLTGAVGVYERAGFTVQQRFVDYHGAI